MHGHLGAPRAGQPAASRALARAAGAAREADRQLARPRHQRLCREADDADEQELRPSQQEGREQGPQARCEPQHVLPPGLRRAQEARRRQRDRPRPVRVVDPQPAAAPARAEAVRQLDAPRGEEHPARDGLPPVLDGPRAARRVLRRAHAPGRHDRAAEREALPQELAHDARLRGRARDGLHVPRARVLV